MKNMKSLTEDDVIYHIPLCEVKTFCGKCELIFGYCDIVFRHSRFGGTYVIKNMKSISEGDVIYHKPLCEVETFSLDTGKCRKKISKNRAPIKTDSTKRRSTLSMRLSLQEFCVQFLVNAYNPLMRAVKVGCVNIQT